MEWDNNREERQGCKALTFLRHSFDSGPELGAKGARIEHGFGVADFPPGTG